MPCIIRQNVAIASNLMVPFPSFNRPDSAVRLIVAHLALTVNPYFLPLSGKA